MTSRICFAVFAMSALAAVGMRAQSPTGATLSQGRASYDMYCAACHGVSAKGDGPIAASMRKPPPDLTQLAVRSNGNFSVDDVSRIVDGRKPLSGHGGPDMPVWGDAFSRSSDPTPVDQKVRSLAFYLASIQAKP
ncbi:MAG TPA: cytochrome c [Vicinamibacterales bacterium]|nr:cytochrome c [Vicinamibacterales bacterium]